MFSIVTTNTNDTTTISPALKTMHSLVYDWELWWYDDYDYTASERALKRADLESKIRALGATDAACVLWVEAIDVSLAEQAKYEAWSAKMESTNDWFAPDGVTKADREAQAQMRDQLIAERDALMKQYILNGKHAPLWTWPNYDPRTGPAAMPHVNGKFAPRKPYKGSMFPANEF